jgi:crotonobetaine/carnitine-CoA ligase
VTFAAELAARASEAPERTALWFDDQPVTFAGLEQRVTSVANQLLGLGLAPGDTVALFTGNCAEWVDVWLAAARIGAISVPVNAAFRGEFLAHQLRDCGAAVALVDGAFLPRLLEVAGDLPELRAVVVRGEPAAEVPAALQVVESEVLYAGDTERVAGGRPIPADEPATLVYTSGTTGPSKGAVLTQQYLLTSARSISAAYGYGADDVIYGAVPLFHFSGTLGVVLPALTDGVTSVLDAAFHPGTCWDRIRQHKATVFVGVGPMVLMLWGLPPDPADAELPIRLLVAAPIPLELHRPIEDRYGCRIVTGYGMTEAFPLAIQGVDTPAVPGSVGRPSPNFEVRLVGDEDREVAAGESGEIVCRPRRPHCMFEGYHGRPEATLAQLANLWFHTGDLGRFDGDGNLFFVDRKKDAIRRRGENISSFEVERAVLAHAAVAACAAVAVPSPLGEDDVKVCVVLKPDTELDATDLMDHCVAGMPYFAVPRYVEFVTALPLNAVGRVQKFRLREQPVTEATWDREAAGYVVAR